LRKKLKSCKAFNPLTKLIFGTGVYSESYYQDVERIEAKSMPVLAEWIIAELKPKTILDIGCGPGHLMASLNALGADCIGVDISDASLRKTSDKGLECHRHDLTDPAAPLPASPFDLAISCEVAEHLEQKHAKTFVKKLTSSAPVIFLTAAEPDGMPGMHHFNEQPNAYWIDLIEKDGFVFDAEKTQNARELFAAKKVIRYLAKPMIFRAQS